MGRRDKQRQYAERARKREQREAEENRARSARGGFPFDPEDPNSSRNGDNHGWRRFKEAQMERMPEELAHRPTQKVVKVFVEGYEDVSFWHGIFSLYANDRLAFEVNVPPDLAKGKKVILSMLDESSPERVLFVDSDFDYLFGDSNQQSRIVNNSKYLFHTYAYSAESFLCYAPSLHNVCVKATKNDAYIFDFVTFMAEYSKTIYPLFIWYAYSAFLKTENIFTLLEFKNAVKLNYLEVENNGETTLAWLSRQVGKRLHILESNNPAVRKGMLAFETKLRNRGLTPETTYLFMQGHTLMDNVVMILLNAVCEQLKMMSNIRISTSTKTGVALKNEMSNYNNSLRNVRDVLLDNESYKDCPLYKKLEDDIENFLARLRL